MSLSHGALGLARRQGAAGCVAASFGNGGGRGVGFGGGGGGGSRITPVTLSIVKLLFLSVAQLPLSYAAPLFSRSASHSDPFRAGAADDEVNIADDASLWAYLGVATALVLLGGAFAGLTIALMGQDEIYLQVIATSGEGSEKRNAGRVLRLLKRGKHWVLVTLLLSNVITNETLPIVLDRSLGGGWPAVLSSTVLIVIFGEIAPQSICVRYGLPIGAFMSPAVLALMWIMAPVAWPTAKFLDWILGEDHGTVYKKAGLKTLVTLHKTLGTSPAERLNEDEVTIISAVLDLKDKPVGSIMTPMGDVFTMSADTVLDEKMMDTILSQGYSRIPIYAPDNPRNFIGMLLVKILITYDPEDCSRVRDFSLATLPETAPETSCLDIVNFFQEGKSHMVLVSDFPGQDKGALGVVTLEDVIEELIGEEIIDESDVFVDVHKAIRRIAPAPRMRYTRSITASGRDQQGRRLSETPDNEETRLLDVKDSDTLARTQSGTTSRETTLLMRRSSSTGSSRDFVKPMPVRSNTADLRQHLKHLGPSNVASRPKTTKYTSVKIKPGVGTIPENKPPTKPSSIADTESQRPQSPPHDASAASDAKERAQALVKGYGTMTTALKTTKDMTRDEDVVVTTATNNTEAQNMTPAEATAFADGHTLIQHSSKDGNEDDSHSQSPQRDHSPPHEDIHLPEKIVVEGGSPRVVSREGPPSTPAPAPATRSRSASSHSTVGEMGQSMSRPRTSRTARSGSITENVIDVNGMKKVVLQTTTNNSSEADDDKNGAGSGKGDSGGDGDEANKGDANGGVNNEPAKKKKKKKRAGKKFRNKEGRGSAGGSGESTPLLS